MAFGKAGNSASEMLSGLKSRLGFSQEDENDAYDSYEEDLDEYDEYDDEYGEGYDEYESYESSYDEYADDEPRQRKFGRPDSTPDLVTINDVREHNKSYVPSSRGSYESAHRADSAYRSNRNTVQSRGTGASYSTSYGDSSTRSDGYNSLFESTASSRNSNFTPLPGESINRGLTVIKPYTYNDVEGIARALKAGDAVVLSMRNTPDDLFKRILDFSFGVASALDASIDCPAAKVYAIINGAPLTEEEKSRLRTQGIL